jgi:CRISPR-associated exonuclease Cas4
MLASGVLPPAVNDARCKHCSLIDSCLPSVIGQAGRTRALQASLFLPSELPS